jgi:hypothetical protein
MRLFVDLDIVRKNLVVGITPRQTYFLHFLFSFLSSKLRHAFTIVYTGIDGLRV